MKQHWASKSHCLGRQSSHVSEIRGHGMNQGEIMQDISVRAVFGRRSFTWIAQAAGGV